jgi:hypothetical protein
MSEFRRPGWDRDTWVGVIIAVFKIESIHVFKKCHNLMMMEVT